MDTSSNAVLAAALDPRFRDLKFLQEDEQDAVKDLLIELASIGTSPVVPPAPSSEPPAKRNCFLDDLLSEEIANEGESVVAEVLTYLQERPVSRVSDPLTWWAANASRFPRLANIAKRYLCIPATSVSSERVFSFSGRIADKRRSRLSAPMIDAIVFLHKNAFLLKLSENPLPRPEVPLTLAIDDAAECEDLPQLPQLQVEQVALDTVDI